MKRRAFDEAFKEMAVELSYLKKSVKEAADELGIDPGRISKWRQQKSVLGNSVKLPGELTEEQKQVKRLQKELQEALLERDILKKAVSIFSKGDGKYSGL
jgi:transposase